MIDRSDKAETPLMERPNQTLLDSIVADGAPRRTDAGAQRCLGDAAALPNGLDELVLAHKSITAPNEVNQQVEHLRLDADDLTASAQLMLPQIDFELGEAEIQNL